MLSLRALNYRGIQLTHPLFLFIFHFNEIAMNRIINDPDQVVEEAIKGYLAAYPHFFAKTAHEKVLIQRYPSKGK